MGKNKSQIKKFINKVIRKYRTNRRLQWVTIAMAILFAVFLYFIGFRSSVRQDIEYVVAPGVSVSAAARDLKSQGFIKSEDTFKFLVAQFGGTIKAGVYDIPRGASEFKIAEIFATGHVATTLITIPEGLTVKQIVNLLSANKYLTGDICDPDSTGSKRCPPDGALFPDTYRVAKGTPRNAMIDLMARKMKDIGAEFKGHKLPKPLKNWEQVITLASIVQKETPRVSEMPTVASVYLNRLNKGMRLQADPTVVYAITNRLGDMQGQVLYTNSLKYDSPYNTYRNHGLPPHPIANVGKHAIAAVLNPANTNYYFFVADGTGGHVFSHDFEGHTANREKWREIKKSRQ